MTAELSLAEQVLDMVGPGPEAMVAVIRAEEGLTRFANSFIHQHVGETAIRVVLKLVDDGRMASDSTSRATPDGLHDLVERVKEAAAVAPVDHDWAGLAPPAPVDPVEHHDEATADADPATRAAQVKAFCDAGPELKAAGYVETGGAHRAFANSAGQRLSGRHTRATLEAIHQTDSSAGLAHHTSGRLADIDGKSLGELAARLARDSRNPVDIEPGHYEVVLSPECVSLMIAYLAYYGFNAKPALEGQSFAEIGAAQFDSKVSIWDDATDPRALHVPFDAEGTPKRNVTLVDAGVTASLAHDRSTAKRAGTESTGHAVPGGERFGAAPTDLFLATGTSSFEEMVASVERGLIVTEFNYVRVLDPKTTVSTGLTRNGTFLVEGGEVARPVTNLRFTQSFVAALGPGQVKAIGRDARFGTAEGMSGVFAPPMHLAEWNFTGGARG